MLYHTLYNTNQILIIIPSFTRPRLFSLILRYASPYYHAPDTPIHTSSPSFHSQTRPPNLTKPLPDSPSTHVINSQAVYAILVRSGLSRDRLASLWSLANLGTPGQLTVGELYTILAAVATEQSTGRPVTSLQALIRFRDGPPVPYLGQPSAQALATPSRATTTSAQALHTSVQGNHTPYQAHTTSSGTLHSSAQAHPTSYQTPTTSAQALHTLYQVNPTSAQAPPTSAQEHQLSRRPYANQTNIQNSASTVLTPRQAPNPTHALISLQKTPSPTLDSLVPCDQQIGGLISGPRVGGVANGSLVGGVSNGSLVGGVANGSLVGAVSNGSLVGAVSNGSRVGGVANGSLVGNTARPRLNVMESPPYHQRHQVTPSDDLIGSRLSHHRLGGIVKQVSDTQDDFSDFQTAEVKGSICDVLLCYLCTLDTTY